MYRLLPIVAMAYWLIVGVSSTPAQQIYVQSLGQEVSYPLGSLVKRSSAIAVYN